LTTRGKGKAKERVAVAHGDMWSREA